MSPIEIIDLALRFALVALAAAGLITVDRGIRAMQRSAAQRAAEHDQRHAEAMAALRELIGGQRSDRAALHVLIERTAPPAAPTAE